MDRDERLRRAVAAFGGDAWALVDTALAVAARDRPGELRARRDGIVERLYAAAAAGCSSCDARPPPRDALAAAGLDDEEDAEEAAAAAPASPEAEGDAVGAGAAEEVAAGGEPGLESRIMAIRDFLEDPDQVPEEAIFTPPRTANLLQMRSFFHANCARLWCFLAARRRAGELAAEPGRHGHHLQGAAGQALFPHPPFFCITFWLLE